MTTKIGLISCKKNINLRHSRAKRLRSHTEVRKEGTKAKMDKIKLLLFRNTENNKNKKNTIG